MTTTTPETVAIPADETTRRPSARFRFGIAFAIGLLLTLAAGAAAMYAYDQQYVGRILPGVSIGGIDLSGQDPSTAAASLRTVYDELADGEIVLKGPDGDITIPYREVGREADIDGMVDAAMGIGRDGNPVERAVADIRTAMRGVTLEPQVVFDQDLVEQRITGYVGLLRQDPAEAAVNVGDGAFTLTPGKDGRTGDPTEAITTALATLGRLDAPSRLELPVPMTAIPPAVTTVEAQNAKALAERLTAGIELKIKGQDDSQWLTSARLKGWTTFAATPEGGYAPTVDTTELTAVMERLATKMDKAPVNASFKTSGGRITGVTKSHNGYTVNVDDTVAKVQAVLAERASGMVHPAVAPVLTVTKPVLTTAEAEAARPKMKRISSWTTYFPISEKNGFGANIWIPARLIDGYVVAPRATFDFWDAVGPVSRAKGYRSGGAIINGRTEPQGALAGGICSCSTTLFNAALRAGYDMGARRNHYYYIDRYPLGLDATVFISASGSKQTMSFTNDTDYPILIRGRGWREGGAGYVRFDLYSVPNGRKVSFSKPIVRNVRQASDSVQYTSSLPAGTRKRIEYPVDGKQVWVTRTVRSKAGEVIHRDEYYSNYARITGIVLVGR